MVSVFLCFFSWSFSQSDSKKEMNQMLDHVVTNMEDVGRQTDEIVREFGERFVTHLVLGEETLNHSHGVRQWKECDLSFSIAKGVSRTNSER